VTSTTSSAGAHDAFHARARHRGVNPLVYWLVRAVLQPFFHLYFRLSRIGREHVPDSGPVILCANHRSFLDPFVIGTIVRRPVYYVAKQELFRYRFVAWFLNSLGAFPVVRGAGDQDMMTTAKAILDRGDAVLVFAEGTRVRPGALGRPKRGVGRLALETGAPVVPVAVFGTEAVRKGWRVRPHKVRIRVGSPLTFPKVEHASPQLAAAVTDRIWPNVMLQWEWLGGLPPLRRAAVIGAGAWGTTVAAMLARAGLQVDLGTLRGDELPGVNLPEPVRLLRAGELELSRHDLVCFAAPAAALPAVVAEHGANVPRRAGVLVLSEGMVPPLGTLPAAYVAERTESWAVGAVGGLADPSAALEGGASLVLAATDAGFLRQVTDALVAAGVDVSATSDVVGVQLAGVAADAAALAVAAAAPAGPNTAGSAAGKVLAEVEAYARSTGAAPGTFAGLAGAGDLVATVLAGDRHPGTAASVPLLADRVTAAGLQAPVLHGLAGVIEGTVAPERWTASLTAPRPAAPSRRDNVKVA
jgi:1-acyl-sn-glycerol-3-phosphate acyltransferase